MSQYRMSLYYLIFYSLNAAIKLQIKTLKIRIMQGKPLYQMKVKEN